MIVVGIDPHKQTHTAVAVEAASGALVAERTVPAREGGYGELLTWVRSLAGERVFALEDCRHVSGSLERFLLSRGERVVRVPPRLMGECRRGQRGYGKSDPIDALAVARALLRERELPAATLAGREREIKLRLAHHDQLVGERTRTQNRLRWHLHELDPAFAQTIPAGALDRYRWLARVESWLKLQHQDVAVEIAGELVDSCERLSRRIRQLERDLARLVDEQAAPLLQLPGCGPLTAAKLVAEVAGVGRFANEAKLAMHGGAAPLDASSGQQRRHRLNRRGNRQLNSALHRIAITQARCHPPAQAYLTRQQAQGKTRREALRCLKRQLIRPVYQALKQSENTMHATPNEVTSRSVV